VTRLTRAIRSLSGDGIQQIVYYQAGVGSTGTLFNRFVGGSIGAGLADNVREAYAFVCNNYFEGDEIFLIGFSRGAFTARSVAGLICNIGVLTKKGLPAFPIIYKVILHDYLEHLIHSILIIWHRTLRIDLTSATRVRSRMSHSPTSHVCARRTTRTKCTEEA